MFSNVYPCPLSYKLLFFFSEGNKDIIINKSPYDIYNNNNPYI